MIFHSHDIEIFVFYEILRSLKLHLCLFLLNPKSYQNEIWANTSVLYDKHFYHVFWLNAGDWKLVAGSFMILFK